MARLRMLEFSGESKCQGGVLGSSAIARQRQELSAFFSYLRHEAERLLDGGGTGASIGMAPQDDPDTLSSDEFCSTVFEEVKRTLLCVGHICDNLQPLTGAVSFPLLILFLFPCLSVSAVRFLAIFLVMATVPIIPLMGHQVPHFVS